MNRINPEQHRLEWPLFVDEFVESEAAQGLESAAAVVGTVVGNCA
jgi:hypothetical protein